jgi:transcriptional regulator with XRE-family HTH domain
MRHAEPEEIASELLRALRAHRSQVQFSRRLGYTANVAYTWESGRRWPTAARTLFAARRVGVDLEVGLRRFYRTPPEWLDEVDVATPEGVAYLLRDLKGGTPIVDLAARVGRSRFAVARWLKGTAEPRLPDFLRLIQGTSARLLDFLAVLTDPAALPSVAEGWQALESARGLIVEAPQTQLILLALELDAYQSLPAHEAGWLADRVGISLEVETEALQRLADTGQIELREGIWQIGQVQAIDTRRYPDAGQRLKRWWAELGLQRLSAQAEGVFSYNAFVVSDAEFEALQGLHRKYYRTLRSIVEASTVGDRVVVVNLQLFALDRPDDD